MQLISGKMTSKGQITIPKELRDRLNVQEGDQFRFFIKDDNVTIEPIKKKKLSNAIGKITVTKPIDLEAMRKSVQEQASKEIFSNGLNTRHE